MNKMFLYHLLLLLKLCQYIPLTAEEIIVSCVILAVSAGRVYNLAASASLYAAPLTQLQ